MALYNPKIKTWQNVAGQLNVSPILTEEQKKQLALENVNQSSIWNIPSIYPKGINPIQQNSLILPAKLDIAEGVLKPGVTLNDIQSKTTINNTPPIEPPKQGDLSTIDASNIASGISSGVNAVASIYGAIQASKMKPVLAKYQAPIEPTLVKDNTSAILTAGQENIDKSINTTRSLYQRNGITGQNGALIGKETEALNQLGGQLAQYRQGIDSANAQIENQTKQYNSSMEANKDQFNAQTQNQFDQYKSSLISAGMKNATDAFTTGTESIFGNIMAGNQMQLSSINGEISTIMEQMKSPKWGISNPGLADRLKTLQDQKNQINNSLFGKPQLKA